MIKQPHRAIRGSAFAPAASRLLPHPSYPVRVASARASLRLPYAGKKYSMFILLSGVPVSHPNIKTHEKTHHVSATSLPSTHGHFKRPNSTS
jgi:hypothetical protein